MALKQGHVERRTGRWLPWAIALLAVPVCAPLLVVLTAPLHTQAPEWGHVSSVLLPGQVRDTMSLLAWSLAVALLVGVPTAWFVTVIRMPMRGLLRWALVLPLALPTYISAITYASVLGPTGSFSIAMRKHLGIGVDIMTIPGLGIVLGLVLYPYVHLAARAAFSRGMTTQLDAARTLGAGALRRTLRVALPMAWPAIAGGALLVAMETLNDYGAVKYYGIHTLTTGVFRSWSGLQDMGSALRLGSILMGIVVLLMLIVKATSGPRSTTDQQAMTPRRHGPWATWGASAACVSVVLAGAVLPLAILVSDALSVMEIVQWQRLAGALGNTLRIATMAAMLIIVLALAFAYLERHGGRRAWGWLVRGTHLGYVVPGAVIAVGAMTAAALLEGGTWWRPALIGGTTLLLAAYVTRFLGVAGHPLRGALARIPPELGDAARVLGADRSRIWTRIDLPLVKQAILAATMLVLIDVVKELPLTLILRPFDTDTLSTLVFEMAIIEEPAQAAPAALVIVLCGMLPVLLLDRLMTVMER